MLKNIYLAFTVFLIGYALPLQQTHARCSAEDIMAYMGGGATPEQLSQLCGSGSRDEHRPVPKQIKATTQLTCEGKVHSSGATAQIQGTHTFETIPGSGGKVNFWGELFVNGHRLGRLTYNGYTNLLPYEGMIRSETDSTEVAIVDKTGNSGNTFLIQKRRFLTDSITLATLYCNWENHSIREF